MQERHTAGPKNHQIRSGPCRHIRYGVSSTRHRRSHDDSSALQSDKSTLQASFLLTLSGRSRSTRSEGCLSNRWTAEPCESATWAPRPYLQAERHLAVERDAPWQHGRGCLTVDEAQARDVVGHPCLPRNGGEASFGIADALAEPVTARLMPSLLRRWRGDYHFPVRASCLDV